ncbi:phosphoglycerol transferase MdoB-like AlkP superfamily enzyme [Plasticicumulans lactativorans]|uniref:Phosphoglycerol transferase MdoB-like AlkP superfamily enzyme n=1 Tax=Plasticicumulans lactativorans TaxID=1133106 RepID=A0A4R2LBS9_9GAMM|nr:LTA synthase family protein [Plasticicumulans lactativorans]TCO81765.1 phosphoglycerol transferase MdoB-like AlkP superfamily enzyme [Plasticicumulans lactativorans]
MDQSYGLSAPLGGATTAAAAAPWRRACATALLAATLALLLGEALWRDGLIAALAWVGRAPLAAAVNLALALGIVLLTIGACGRWLGAALGAGGLVAYALINRHKADLLGVPVTGSDFRLAGQYVDTLRILMGEWRGLWWPLVALAGLGAVALYRRLPRERLPQRLAAAAAGLALLAPVLGSNGLGAYGLRPTWFSEALTAHGLRYVGWDLRQNVTDNGQLLAIVWNVEQSLVVAPRGYRPERVAALYAQPVAAAAPATRPDVVVVMSEAWWDAARLAGDAAAPFAWTGLAPPPGTYLGEAVSPAVGGLTCNAEFEFLTGNSMALLPEGAIPYVDYVLAPTFSLARHLRTLGYETIAVHPFERHFWKRDEVYRHFGFDRYVALDDFVDPEHAGYFVADRELVRRILAELGPGDGRPRFVFAVSMQNHLPFAADKYPEAVYAGLGPLPPGLGDDSREAVRAHMVGARDAWQGFVALAEALRARGQPALLVQFGDHLPGFDRVYVEAGYVGSRDPRDWSPAERLRMHATPLAVWASHVDARTRLELQGPTSLAFVGTHLLHGFGLDAGRPWLRAGLERARAHPVLLRGLVPAGDDTALAAELRDWQWMQHDGLFGTRRNLPPEVYLSDTEEPPTAADAPLATATDAEET